MLAVAYVFRRHDCVEFQEERLQSLRFGNLGR